MAGPASKITITIEALTEEANAKLNAFFKSQNVNIVSANTASAAAGVAATQQLAKGLDQVAAQTTVRIAGMTYYFRSAMDGIRLAMAGGGARAGFYAIDEAVRGLVASGTAARGALIGVATELAEMIPLLAPAALGWMALNAFLSKPLPMVGYLVKENDELKKQAELLKTLNALKEAGVITDQQFRRFAMQPNSAVSRRDMMTAGLTVPGKNGDQVSESAQALMAISQIFDEIKSSTADEGGKKISELTDKFQKLKDAAQAAGLVLLRAGKLTQEQYEGLIKTVSEAGENATNKLVAGLNLENLQRNQQAAADAFAKGQQMFTEIVRKENADLDRELNLSAAQQGKTREEIYQEEYRKRLQLLESQLYAGEISEKEYTDAVQEAEIKRLEGLKREQQELMRLADERHQMQVEAARDAAEQTLRNPDAHQVDKQAAMQSLISMTEQLLDQNRSELELAATEAQRNDLIRERQKLEHDYSEYLIQQAQMEHQINDARVAGVRTMFGNMGAAAKMFGREGVAVYKGFAIAQATIDTAKAAIGAYSSVVGIPYVGPILAPIAAAAAVAAGVAQISAIESAAYMEGGFTGSGPTSEVAGVVHRGEFVIPAARVQQYGLGFMQAIHAGQFSAATGDISGGGDGHGGEGGPVIQHKTELSLATFGGEADAKRWADSQEGEVWFLSMFDKHAYKYQRG